MRRRWRRFAATEYPEREAVAWEGCIIGLQRSYRISIEYGLPLKYSSDFHFFRRFPLVRVLEPTLEPNYKAVEEAPLPHVYLNQKDERMSPLCLFDPALNQWDHHMLISETTVPWAVDWLVFYEGWLATGRWFGGGRHNAGLPIDGI